MRAPAPFIIAEAGVNHNGSLEIARKLVEAARKAGASCVKFQTFDPKMVAASVAAQADYQVTNTGIKESQQDMLAKLALSRADFTELAKFCKTQGIEFLSTAFDLPSFEFLLELGLKRVKIPSGEITNPYMLDAAAESGLPVILSTGMATMKEIEWAVARLRLSKDKLTILQCTTNYPAAGNELNLSVIAELKKRFGCTVGFSDHSLGGEAALVALGLGATVFEKHITLDTAMPGPDHKASMDVPAFENYVRALTACAQAIGDGVKRPSAAEELNLLVVRRSLFAARALKKGETLSREDLVALRPLTGGIAAEKLDQVVGATLAADLAQGAQLKEDFLK